MSNTRPRKPRRTSPRYSRIHPPTAMATHDWQVALRRQFGRDQSFKLENLGSEPVFSEFRITNPTTGGCYRVAIRGIALGDNYCACPDFATSQLGTCKHIEFTLAKLERRRGGKTALREGFQPAFSEVWLRYGAERRICFRPGQSCTPALLKRARSTFDEEDGWSLPWNHHDLLDPFIAAANRSTHEVRIYHDALESAAVVRRRAAREHTLAIAFPQGPRTPELRNLLKLPLYPYQCEGALFAAVAGRAIIADDMGLGKTVQAIAAAEILLRHCDATRVLIVCPASLKHQWQNEIDRLTDHQALVIGGPKKLRNQQFAMPAIYKITNYDTVRRDVDLINAWAPDLVIADEAQRIKNWETQAARALKKVTSPYAFVLTGTPLENKLQELLSVVQFVDQYRLGPTWRFLENHQIYSDTGQVIGYRQLDAVGETLAPILIRRRKSDVLPQLPPRSDKTYLLPLTPPQRALHDENAETVARIVARWRKQRYLSKTDQKRLMAALQNMRMVCVSSYLLDPTEDHGTKIPELARVLDEVLAVAQTKVVIFSQWRRSHELLVRVLESRGYGYVLFHGGVPTPRRGKLIERFNQDSACRVFLSTDAGGVGLNLQRASVVVNLDLPWNPAVLEQRIGRLHRLGQHRPVRVLNFVAEQSIEQNMLGLLAFKQSLADGVLDGGDKEIHLGGTRLTKFMESVERATDGPAQQYAANRTLVNGAAVNEAAVHPDIETDCATTAYSHRPSADNIAEKIESPWLPLVALGQELLAGLADPGSSRQDKAPGATALVHQDPQTGERYLKLPVPEPAVVARLADALRQLLHQ